MLILDQIELSLFYNFSYCFLNTPSGCISTASGLEIARV